MKGLGALQLFIGLGGVAGGAALVLDPSGDSQGIPLALLENTPFVDYLIPGLVLFFVIGLGTSLAGVLTIRRNRYAGGLAVVCGVILIVWIVAQVWWIGLLHWLQPAFFALGFVESLLGLRARTHHAG